MTTTANIIAHVRGIVASYADGGECDQARRLIFADYLGEIGEDDAATMERWLAENNKWPLSCSDRSGGWYEDIGITDTRHYHLPVDGKWPILWKRLNLKTSRGKNIGDLIKSELLILGLEHLCQTPVESAA